MVFGAELSRTFDTKWPSAHPATVPGLWVRGLLNVRWDLVVGLSGGRFGASWGLFWASWGPILGLLVGPLASSWGRLRAEGSKFPFGSESTLF